VSNTDAAPAHGLDTNPLALPSDAVRSWRELERTAADCTLCRLCEDRTKVVFGDGAQDADVVVVGDAPGRTEDLLGRPFVGAAGNLLDNLLLDAGFDRDDVYVTTVVKCHPRTEAPDRDVVDACSPYLVEQLAHLRPRVIITLGPVATGLLLQRPVPLDKVAGFRFDVFDGVTLVPTHHPATVIKGNQAVVASIRRDLMTARAVLEGRLSTGAEAMAELRARAEEQGVELAGDAST
jgi:uracil-DNA glycosylase family 4